MKENKKRKFKDIRRRPGDIGARIQEGVFAWDEHIANLRKQFPEAMAKAPNPS